MDNIVRLSREEDAALTDHAERFARREHKGDTLQALKAMMLLNSDLQKRLDTLSGGTKFARLKS